MKHMKIVILAALLGVAGPLFGQGPSTEGATNNPAKDQETRELKPLDVLRFNIPEDGSRIQFPPVTITELGDAHFPISASSQDYIPIKAAGRLLADLRKELKQKLDADYYRNATVNLELLSTKPPERGNRADPSTLKKIVIYGALSQTIQLQEDEKMTLSEAIARLSIQNRDANLKKVELLRADPITKQLKSTIKNVRKMLDGDLSEDVELKDGDRIKVAEKVFNAL